MTSWTQGTKAGTNNNTNTATASGLGGSPVTFRASGTAGGATQIAVNGGNNQTAGVNSVLPVDPSVIVTDALGNPVAGISVTFSVAAGNGSITGETSATNASGVAEVGSWQLPATARTNTLTAAVSGLTGSPVTFTATGTATTAASVASSDISAVFGQSITFTATVTSGGGTPTGSVRFVVDGSEAAVVALAGGQAVYATAGLALGSQPVRIEYLGENGFLPSSHPEARSP